MARPDFAETPGPGQESVWDYPRPPRVEPTSETVEVRWHGHLVARTNRALRVLETAHAPAYYIPAGDVDFAWLQPNTTSTWCEFKGRASYADLATPAELAASGHGSARVNDACWWYAEPVRGFEAIAGAVCFYPQRADCTVDGEVVRPVGSDFYGDWVTSRIVGPWKGAPGTAGW